MVTGTNASPISTARFVCGGQAKFAQSGLPRLACGGTDLGSAARQFSPPSGGTLWCQDGLDTLRYVAGPAYPQEGIPARTQRPWCDGAQWKDVVMETHIETDGLAGAAVVCRKRASERVNPEDCEGRDQFVSGVAAHGAFVVQR